MKQFRFLTMAALIAFGTSLCAQNVITLDEMQARKKQEQEQQQQQQQPQQQQQQQVVKEKSSKSSSDVEGFGTLYVQYSPSKMKSKDHSSSGSTNVNAVSLGYSYAMPLGGIPLYLEFGAAAQYFFKSENETYDDYDIDYETGEYSRTTIKAKAKFSMLSVKIPINIMYSIDISDAFSIQPYAGVYGRINIFAKQKYEAGGESETYDMFNKSDIKELSGKEDFVWKRFQVGWNAGVKFRIAKKVSIGAGYYMDIMKIMSYKEHKTNFQGIDLTLGLTF